MLLTDHDRGVHDYLASRSLQSVVDTMPEPRIVDGDAWRSRVIELRAENEADSSKAVALHLPFGNGYSPAMHIRALTLQKLLPQDTRVIVFPNNTRGEEYQTPIRAHARHRSPLEVLGYRSLRVLETLGVETLAVSGDSQGAGVAAAALVFAHDRFVVPCGAASLRDPADMMNRSPRALGKAFRKTGLGNLNRAINDSGLPALSEAQRSRGGADLVLQSLGMLRFGLRDARTPMNKALHKAMAANDFSVYLEAAAFTGAVGSGTHVALFEDSRVSRNKQEEYYLAHRVLGPRGGQLEIIKGYGHEGGDNVVLSALLARRAFQAAGFFPSVSAA